MFENGSLPYDKIYEVTNTVIEKYYKKRGWKVQFPIDIGGIVKSYGIQIIETNLNVDMGFCIPHKSGSLRYLEDTDEYQIYLEDSDSDNVKRYVLAHEFGHFILGDKKNRLCVDPLFYKDWKEQVADVIAAYLLFPHQLVLEKMWEYTENMKQRNQYPIVATDWLRELAETARVSSYHTILCYQYVKSCICYLYQQKHDSVMDSRFGRLFR